MKAIILKEYGSVDNFETIDIPVPPVPKGHVRIKIKAASFNPVDYQIRKGLPESNLVRSNILGRDLSGIIDKVDGDVKEFKKGDEVYCYVANLGSSGTYAEYVSVPACIVAKKPISLSHEQAAAVPVAGITAWLALTKTKAKKSKSVFIAGGAGGVGSFTIIFAKQLGLQNIVATAGSEESVNYLLQKLELQQHEVVNYRDIDFIKKAIEQNSGHFDVALDLVGGRMLSACCNLIKVDGNLASVVEAPDRNDFEILFDKNASFHSICANAYSLGDNENAWRFYQQILNYFSVLFDKKSIPEPQITVLGSLSLDVVKKAHSLLEHNSVQGKLIMTC